MSIADKLTELAEIRADMREKLIAKGVDANTHNFSDFPDDVESIPSGGDGSLELLGQMDTRVYCNSSGQVATNSSSPGPYSTFVYALPTTTTGRVSTLVKKSQLSNRFRAVYTADNPLNLPIPSSGNVTTGTYNAIVSDSNASSYLTGASSVNAVAKTYLVLNISGNSGTEPAPKVWACVE